MVRSEQDAWPAVEAPLLAAISAAFHSRGKAIRYWVASFDLDRELEERDGSTVQRLNVTAVSIGGKPSRTRLSVWMDGTAWFDVRKPAKRGWGFELSLELALEDVAAPEIVRRFERSVHLAGALSAGSGAGQPFTELWNASG